MREGEGGEVSFSSLRTTLGTRPCSRGVDADALLGTAALLYLLRFSGDVVPEILGQEA